jgi:hypothetical protein
MKKTICAGAVVLAAFGLLSEIPAANAYESTFAMSEQPAPAASINIGRIKEVLRLTPEQEAFWPPVEAALRGVARQQTHTEQASFVRRIGQRVVSIVLDSTAIERLAFAARPLIAVLDAEQRRAASGLAHEMGFGAVVAALK